MKRHKSKEIWAKILFAIYSYGHYIKTSIRQPLLRKILLLPYAILDFLIVRGVLNCLFPYQLEVGKGLTIWHPYGIVIHSQAIIGENVTIRQHVTIGKAHDEGGLPIIGNNVSIGAGAIIIDEIKIGDNTVIGANAVVTKSCPENAVLVGVPAKNISNSHVEM
ncbi:serine acetyltransferase [Enterococcus villorum]|uniref:Serine acetyltransferase n=2 Tax=Enterococcus villorum TaxID=112904 RepID=A0A511J3C5_9ENTE|nr:serine acetyltransferase [Enterococcus villorum]EOH91995.1 hypothetical protein UAO_00666 [Enterococcus villorum ATCC 700913]EOW76711.1 hypothetical protein I591_02019 [Enterococcus villorum ATCC 700913]GEL92517.1 putative colanic acid biosynthesis acetyltransferase wcaB [Enterococcus villorum]